MTSLKITALVVAASMLAAIVYGFATGDFWDEGSDIWALSWGRVSLIDLYAGLVLFAAWVAYRETSRVAIVAWWVALIGLGNLAAAVYVAWAAWRADSVQQVLIGKDRTVYSAE